MSRREFEADFDGGMIRFRRQSALHQLEIPRRAAELAATLSRYGLEQREGYALAYNCVLLWQTLLTGRRPKAPEGMLERYSLSELAELARRYYERDDLPFDEDWYDECGVNESFPTEEEPLV